MSKVDELYEAATNPARRFYRRTVQVDNDLFAALVEAHRAGVRMIHPRLTFFLPGETTGREICRYCGNEYTGPSDADIDHMSNCVWVGLRAATEKVEALDR